MNQNRTVYEYNEAGLYTGETVAEPSPLEKDVWLIPANATELEPPVTGEHECAVFQNGRWSVRYDYRGTTYWLPDGTEHTIAETGMLVPEGALTEPPPLSVEEVRKRKLAELNAAFETATQTAHCTSSAGFEIDADEVANRNIEGLTLVLQAGESTLFRAYDNRFHEVTREQLETMRREIVVNSQWLYQAKWTLENRIATAETARALDAIAISPEALVELAGVLRETTAGEGNGQTV